MDTNPQSIEKSQQILWSSDDHQGQGHVRSYTCSFCKRGFSNAQALGGHMNIHRKDRARLNQANDENLLSLDTSSTNPTHDPEISGERNQTHQLESSEEKSCTTCFSREDDATPNIEELQQLPLFAETPSPSDDKKAASLSDESMVEKNKQFSQGSSSQIQLDLELRLGPDP